MTRVGIIGASGYSGAELLRILNRHRSVTVAKAFANSSAGKRVDEVYPLFLKQTELSFETYTPDSLDGIDVVFIALPSGEAMNLVPSIIDRGKRVIDLGGDFRLKEPFLYEKFYKREHTAREYLQASTYGLPELNKNDISKAQLVANPGCYPTSAILSLAPALAHKFVAPDGIVINSLSGVSGAGRNASLEISFVEVNESVRAYKVGVHQHIPEIKAALAKLTGEEVNLTFVPHLVPINRGIYTTTCAELLARSSEDDVRAVYESYYREGPFVRVLRNGIPEIKNVIGTNYCDIVVRIDRDNNRLIVISAIDNLVKGAAGQAVQNMNIMFGFPEQEGLTF